MLIAYSIRGTEGYGALAVIGPAIRDSGYRPYSLVNRHGKHSKASVDGQALLHSQDTGSRSTSVTSKRPTVRFHADVLRRGDYESVLSMLPSRAAKLYIEDSPAFFIAAYGATRTVDEPGQFSSAGMRKVRLSRYQRIASLFAPQVSLVPLISWLPVMKSRSRGRFAQFRQINDFYSQRVGDNFEGPEGDIAFSDQEKSVMPFCSCSETRILTPRILAHVALGRVESSSWQLSLLGTCSPHRHAGGSARNLTTTSRFGHV